MTIQNSVLSGQSLFEAKKLKKESARYESKLRQRLLNLTIAERSLSRKIEIEERRKTSKQIVQLQRESLKTQVSRSRLLQMAEVEEKKIRNLQRKSMLAINNRLTSQSMVLAKQINHVEMKRESQWLETVGEALKNKEKLFLKQRILKENSFQQSVIVKKSFFDNKRSEILKSKFESIT